MNIAYPLQNFQDWCTQQWVIFTGKNIEPEKYEWLMAPFGDLGSIGNEFIDQLAEKENLLIEKNNLDIGLLPSIRELSLSQKELDRLSPKIIEFYEQTSNYNLGFSVVWNRLFKFFGHLVNLLFSNRINQLYIPTKNVKNSRPITSEIIQLKDRNSKKVKYTIWYRTFENSGKVIYSGIYSTCRLPSGKSCIKAVFPLPKGNATVIMKPSVGENGELILDSSGKKFGDAGFYFLLKDENEKHWVRFVKSFEDRLTVYTRDEDLYAKQSLSLWKQNVLEMKYKISFFKREKN